MESNGISRPNKSRSQRLEKKDNHKILFDCNEEFLTFHKLLVQYLNLQVFHKVDNYDLLNVQKLN